MPCLAVLAVWLAAVGTAAQGRAQALAVPAQSKTPVEAKAPLRDREAAPQRPADLLQAPAPGGKGTVLFERHGSPAEVPEAAAGTQQPVDAAAGRTSSSTPRSYARAPRPGLQRRTPGGAQESTESQGAGQAEGGSRSAEASVSASASSPAMSAADQKAAAAIPDSARASTRILADDLEVHLNEHTGEVTVRARMLVRNDGPMPLVHIPLQISSALHWESATFLPPGVSGTPSSVLPGAAANPIEFQILPIEQHRLLTDVDHTGAVEEVGLTLPKPLPPGESAGFDLYYGGVLKQSAERLIRLGAPAARAAQSDWDAVSDEFTGLRGFGNVLWFPTSSVPILLADGAAFVRAVEEDRARDQDTRLALRLTLETAGSLPDAAFFCGERQPLISASGGGGAQPGDDTPRILTAKWPMGRLGTHPVSLFVADSAVQVASSGVFDAVTEHADTVAAYAAAAERVTPLLTEWLGPRPAAPLHVLNLPVAGAQPFADGNLLVIPMRATEPKVLAPSLVYPLAAAWLPADAAPWLREGIPEFLRGVSLERTEGRESALVDLNASGDQLARQEGFNTATSPSLDRCTDSTCARVKAAFVLGMLRQIAGDDALKQAFLVWRSKTVSAGGVNAAGTGSGGAEFDRAGRGSRGSAAGHGTSTGGHAGVDGSVRASTVLFEQAISQTSGKDLAWFFQDWIDRDAGLPDLTIVSVAPRRVERATINNNVPAERRPTGGPIGPEPVAQPGDPTRPEETTQASRNRIGPAEGSWLVAVEVQNNGGAVAEVPVTVRSGTLQNVLALRIAAHSRATVRVPFEAVPEEVWVNDGTTPETRSVTHRRTIEIPAQYQ